MKDYMFTGLFVSIILLLAFYLRSSRKSNNSLLRFISKKYMFLFEQILFALGIGILVNDLCSLFYDYNLAIVLGVNSFVLSIFCFVFLGRNKTNLSLIVVILSLIVSLIFINYNFYNNFKTPIITMQSNVLNIDAQYGIKLNCKKIKKTKVLNDLPKIKYRIKGSALGSIKKGLFLLEDKRKVYLFLDTRKAPFLMIKLKDKDDCIYINLDLNIKRKILECL